MEIFECENMFRQALQQGIAIFCGAGFSVEAKDINCVTFIWFTDGFGWKNAKNNLKETFNVMEHLYNIHDLDMNILDKIIK